MELLQLRYFLVTAKYEHMTKAAEALRIAQPALSQSIKRLEQELGVSLFDREKRGIRLNETGQLLKEQLMPILETLDALPSALQENVSQQLHTIHLNILAAPRLMTDCIIAYKKRHPEINFRLHQKTEPKLTDLSITTHFPENPLPENSYPLLTEHFFLAVPADSPYASLSSVSLTELKGEAFLAPPKNQPIRRICDQFCLDSGFFPHIIGESDNPNNLSSLIAAGFGIGFWPEYSWTRLTNKDIVLLPIRQPVCEREIILTIRPEKISRTVLEEFCQFLFDYIKQKKGQQLPEFPSALL